MITRGGAGIAKLKPLLLSIRGRTGCMLWQKLSLPCAIDSAVIGHLGKRRRRRQQKE